MVQMRITLVLGYAILGFAAIGCGSSDSSSKKNPVLVEPPRATDSAEDLNLASTSSDSRLNGVWTSQCIDNGNGSSSSITLEITDDYLQQANTIFRYRECIGKVMDARFIMSYSAQNSLLRSTLKQVHLNVTESLSIQAARQASSCGFNGWQGDVWYDLTDKVCVPGVTGVWVTPTRAGTTNATTFALTVSNSDVTLDVGGTILTRPARNGDQPNVMPQPTPPVTPINGSSMTPAGVASLKTGATLGLGFQTEVR